MSPPSNGGAVCEIDGGWIPVAAKRIDGMDGHEGRFLLAVRFHDGSMFDVV